jgi:excisionase family DNA binding protein
MSELTEQLIDVHELAKKLKVQKSWVYSQTRQSGPDSIPIVRVGKYCRFKMADVLQWLEKRSQHI